MSPYDGFENAELSIEVATGHLGVDEVGNAIALTRTIPVKALLKMAPLLSSQNEKAYPGVDASAIKLEGYCSDPMVLPPQTLPENWYRCNWEGQSGWFYLLAPINPPYGRVGIGEILEQAQGTKISGWFQLSRSK